MKLSKAIATVVLTAATFGLGAHTASAAPGLDRSTPSAHSTTADGSRDTEWGCKTPDCKPPR
ncbi:hypothetical protein ACIQRS_21215 [Streptomyces termitum]|uniref:Uncharacterized protein n=1 Tax=Streptomyces termitum TaxID=67368 RepID=A0A918T1Z1_9ACTN|nr:hypothetical protein [Streptomyces termitum]GHA86609.1 hypothetical protein GCM10010305_33070 [Streptomyces termitum]